MIPAGRVMSVRRIAGSALFLALLGSLPLAPLHAQGAPADEQLPARVDAIANEVLQSTGVPSASVAVVQHGRIVSRVEATEPEPDRHG